MNNNVGKRIWGKDLHTAVDSVNLYGLFGGLSHICQNLQSTTALTQQALHLLGTHPTDILTKEHKDTDTGIYVTAFFFPFPEQKNQKQPKYPGIGNILVHLFNKPPVANKQNKIDFTLMQGGHQGYWVTMQGVENYVA